MLVNLNNGTEMNVFKITALSLVIATSAGSLSAMAAETSQITVKGAVFPSACSISVDGTADFGNLKKNELKEKPKEQNAYHLGYKPINFNIHCNSAAKVALSAQADTPPTGPSTIGITSYISDTEKTLQSLPAQLASLALIDGEDIGYFTVALASVALDGKNAELIFSQDNGGSWQAVSGPRTHVMYQDGSVFHGWGKDTTPQEASDISGVITISAAVYPEIVDKMNDAIRFDTGTTLSLHYL
ncbi:DUF1120 domain-containing protein [Serratia silvae]|uniref:DUF1120 domain-containing protein n=1 Tax=Serratia silvae TaxID=2824122 RepID=A0ABT0K7K0_9GAMM|nr:DUF1120 domain-containing protein [Serratia silvae]MCL1027981.1 DUF1120 domain-containing protein [Serratia silvae]